MAKVQPGTAMRMFATYDVAETVDSSDAGNNPKRPLEGIQGAFLFAGLSVGGHSTGSRLRKMCSAVRCQNPSWTYWLSL